MKKILLALGLILILTVLTILDVYAVPPMPPVLTGQCAGIKYKIAWTEPTAPLNDLRTHTIYFTVDEVTILKKPYAVSSPRGGKVKTAIINLTMDCKIKNKIRIWVTSTNTLNEESAKSNVLPLNTEWIEGTVL